MRGSAAFASLLAAVLLLAGRCAGTLYKVGDLDAWGVPPSSKPDVYVKWVKANHFALGDSSDSVVQVTARAFAGCVVSDPVLKLDDGNSVFNLTAPGRFYYTSGQPEHCQKGQKLVVDVPLANGTYLPPSANDLAAAAAPRQAADGPGSSQPAFGPSAAQSSGALPARGAPAGVGSVVAAAVLSWALLLHDFFIVPTLMF